MAFRVEVDILGQAAKHSEQAEESGLLQCRHKFAPVIEPGASEGVKRLPLTLNGQTSSGSVYPGKGKWQIDGNAVQIFEGPDGGAARTTGGVDRFPAIVYAEGAAKGTATLTLTLLPGGGELRDNPATQSLRVKEPVAEMTLEPAVVCVKGKTAKLKIGADLPFDKGVLKIVAGGECVELLANDVPVRSLEFTENTELTVKAVKGSEVDGVEFEWALAGVAQKRTAKLTVVQGTLKIYDKGGVEIGAKQRVLHKAKSRAKVEILCQPKGWGGRLALVAADQRVKLYSNANGNGGESDRVEVAASATPAAYYVEGRETSGGVWDTGLRLHLAGLADDVDEAKITVIETALTVAKPLLPVIGVAPDARTTDFGTGPSVATVPAAEVSGEVRLYGQRTQWRAPRALVRVTMTPKDAPCKLILRAVQEGDKTAVFPEANERHRQGEAAVVHGVKRLEIAPGGIGLAEQARAGAGKAGVYGADGYVLWAEGLQLTPTTTPTAVQLDVDGVDDDCGKVKFHVVAPEVRVEIRRSDGNAFTGAVKVDFTDIATADTATPSVTSQIVPRPTHPNPATAVVWIPIGNYRVTLTPQGLGEQNFRVTLMTPSELPLAVTGPPVDIKFVLDPPYQGIQFLGYRIRTGTYKGLDAPALLTPTQVTETQTQAKAFTMAAVLDALDVSADMGAPQLKLDLKGKSYDQVDGDGPLKLRVETISGLDLARTYAKELKGVQNNLARREGAKNDIEERCDVMVEAMQTAYGATAWAADSRVLKVFMAPEFYFRGAQGAYAVESIHQILPRLSVEMNKTKYVDWLFVLGSALGYREKPEEVYQEKIATVVSAETTIKIASHDGTPSALADTGWNFLVGAASYPIVNKQDTFNAPWHEFEFKLNGVVSYPASGPNTLAVFHGNKTGVTSAAKTAVGRFTFNKAHAGLTIQAGWRLKLQKMRLRILTATKVDNSNWDIEVALKPKQSVATGAGEITKGRMSRDHSGTFMLGGHEIEVIHPAGNMAEKCMARADCGPNGYSDFKFRVAGAMAADFIVDDVHPISPTKSRLTFLAPTAPVWHANSTLAVSPDRCEVFSGSGYKQVLLKVDFGMGPFPAGGWRYEQGTTKGIVQKVLNPVGSRRDLQLRLKVDEQLDVTQPIKFKTSSESVEIFNVCFVQKGGAGAPANSNGTAVKGRMVEKESISSVDFSGPEYGLFGGDEFYDPLHHLIDFYDSQVRATARQGASTAIDQTADATLTNTPGQFKTFQTTWGDERDNKVHAQTISERSASGLGGGSLFEMDGLSYGLEVCLDHLNQRLVKNAPGPVRVQLVPSCGMSIKAPSKKLTGNGFIFNVDGSPPTHSAAELANGTAINSAETPIVSAVAAFGQLFEADGGIVVHDMELL
jgi:hypothetical protein